MKDKIIVKNCPYCGNPPKVQTFKSSSGKRVTRLYCCYYACDMPVEVLGIIPRIAIEAWNDYVDKVKERKNNENNNRN